MFKRCFETFTIIVLILFFMVSSAFAFPNLINYQGKLTDSSDVLLNGEYSLNFKIYSAESGGTPLWTEEQQVMVTNGIYNVELGAVQPLPQTLFDTEMLYLEVIIFNIDTNTDETLSPRIPFNATGFSMKAKVADSVAWSNITGMPASIADNTDNVNDADADPSNEIQTLGTSGNNITLSTDGGSITAPYATNADMVDGKHASELGGGGGDGHSLDAADGSPVDSVYVDNAGNVGIGTTEPTANLDVNGDLRLSSQYLHNLSGRIDSGSSRTIYFQSKYHDGWGAIEVTLIGLYNWQCAQSIVKKWVVNLCHHNNYQYENKQAVVYQLGEEADYIALSAGVTGSNYGFYIRIHNNGPGTLYGCHHFFDLKGLGTATYKNVTVP